MDDIELIRKLSIASKMDLVITKTIIINMVIKLYFC